MADKSVAIRLGIVGGQEVTATFDQIGARAGTAMDKVTSSVQRGAQEVTRSSGALRSQFQNVGYQVQDFAVQVAGGTSATRAMAQQLPQLLSAFGLWGVALGTAAAILVPLAGALFNFGDGAEAAKKKVDSLTKSVDALAKVNDQFTSKGIDNLIQKYGALDAKVLALVEHERQFALDKAITDAHTAVNGLEGGLSGVRSLVQQIADIKAAEPLRGAALSAVDLKNVAQQLSDQFGITVDQAQQIVATLDQAKSANALGGMADATGKLAGLIEQSKLKGSEFMGTLLDANSALMQLNHEGSGIQGWLGTALDWAGGLAAKFWDAARGAAAIRTAAAAADTPLSRQTAMEAAMAKGGQGRGLTPTSATPVAHDATGKVIDISTKTTHMGGGGGGGKTNQLEQDAKAIFDSTRTSAEKYRAEMEKLNAVKKAGLIDGETYNRQVEALGAKYGQQVSLIGTIRKSLDDFASSAADSGKAIGDAIKGAFDGGAKAVGDFVRTGKMDVKGLVTSILGDFAEIAAKKYIFGPLANALSGALGGALGGLGGGIGASVIHEGGFGGGAQRLVPAAAFAGARRYHSGGLVGDEMPAILLKGERVLNRAQTRAYDNGGGAPMVANFYVKDAASLRQSRTQMAADAARLLNASRRAM